MAFVIVASRRARPHPSAKARDRSSTLLEDICSGRRQGARRREEDASGTNMTGKRPRTLRRTSSESLIESVSFTQECSPLPEHPKEKLKPTPVKEPVPAAPPPRLVIGFNPKPLPENAGNGCLKPSSPGSSSSSSSSAKSSSSSSYPPSQQRSGLESLLSVPRERKVVEGVGLSIVAAMNNNTAVVQEELKSSNIVDRRNQRNHHHHHQHVVPAAAATKTDSILHSRPNPYCTIAQKQSMSIPILRVPDSSGSYHKSGRPSQHRFSGGVQQPPFAGAADGQGGRAMVAWLRQADPEEGERDTFLLRTSSSFKTQQVVVVPDAVAAAAASAVHFLDACYFCKRHLVDGKDIYMYRYVLIIPSSSPPTSILSESFCCLSAGWQLEFSRITISSECDVL